MRQSLSAPVTSEMGQLDACSSGSVETGDKHCVSTSDESEQEGVRKQNSTSLE